MPITIVIPSGTSSEVSSSQGCQFVSMSQLKDRLRSMMRAPSAGGSVTTTKWTDAELYLCLREILAELTPFIRTEDVLDLEYQATVRDYELPDYIDEVVSIEMFGNYITRLLPDTTIDIGQGRFLTDWVHDRTVYSNFLRFNELYEIGTILRVRFRSFFQVPLEPQTLSSDITDASILIPVPDPLCFPVPGWVKIDSELIRYQDISMGSSALSSLTRGANAASHTNGANKVDPVIYLPTGLVIEEVVLKGAEIKALEVRLHDSPNQETSRILTLLQRADPVYRLNRKALYESMPGVQSTNLHRPRFKRRRYVM